MKTNPYIAGNPVGGSKAFIGRMDVLKDVLRILNSPHENAIVLFGQRRIGKTSILQELTHTLPQEGSYLPVFFDLQDKAALPLEEVIRSLADRIISDLDIKSFDNWGDDLVNDFRDDFIPFVLQQLAHDTAIVLLFDEFDVLDNPMQDQAATAFFPYLRGLLSMDPKRLKFVFVIGRRTEDLSSMTLSVFKGVKARHVSLLTFEETANLVRLSERNDSLLWPENTLAEMHTLTGGHTYLTQQLCQEVWEQIYDNEPDSIPTVQSEDIKTAIPIALKTAISSLEWLWDGLGPAERVVASALAGAGPLVITQEELEERLHESGVRILVGELRDAPRVLQEWDLIEPASDNKGYKFRVEILRSWIKEHKPIARVQEEIDRIIPVAESLFQAANGFYTAGDFDQAIPLLEQAIGVNPNHLRAIQLLAEIFIAKEKIEEARKLLESLYEYQPAVARPRLVQTLLIQATKSDSPDLALKAYERVLELVPNQPEAMTGKHQILEANGDEAYKEGEFKKALEIFQRIKLTDKIEKVQARIHIESKYGEAITAFNANNYLKAQKLLIEVIAIEPNYEKATWYLHQTTTFLTKTDEPPKTDKPPKKPILSLQRLFKILAILAIIGILAAIAIPNFLAYRTRGFNQAAMSEAKNFYVLSMVFWADTGTDKCIGYDHDFIDINRNPEIIVTGGPICFNEETSKITFSSPMTFRHARSETIYTLTPDGSIDSSGRIF